MNIEKRNMINMRFGLNDTMPLDHKRKLLVGFLQNAQQSMHISQEAKLDVDNLVEYIRSIDHEMLLQKRQYEQSQGGGYQMMYGGHAPVTQYPIPNQVHQQFPIQYQNLQVNTSNVDRYSHLGIVNTHQQQQTEQHNNREIDRFTEHNKNNNTATEQPKPAPIKEKCLDHNYTLLKLNNMEITKHFEHSPQYFKWKVNYIYGKDENETGETSRHYIIRDLIDPLDKTIPLRERVLRNNYKVDLRNEYMEKDDCEILMVTVATEDIYNSKEEVYRLPDNTFINKIWTDVYDRINEWEKFIKSKFVYDILDKKFANILTTCFNALIPEQVVVVESMFEEAEDIYSYFEKLAVKNNNLELIQTIKDVYLMASNIMEQCYTGEEHRTIYNPNHPLEINEYSELGMVEHVFRDRDFFIALYTEHKDFINLHKVNSFHGIIEGKIYPKPLYLDPKFHRGLVTILDKHPKNVKWELITPNTTYIIYKQLKTNKYFVTLK